MMPNPGDDTAALAKEIERTRSRAKKRDLLILRAEATMNIDSQEALRLSDDAIAIIQVLQKKTQSKPSELRANAIAHARARVVRFYALYNSERAVEVLPDIQEAIASFEHYGELIRAATARQKLAFYWLRNFDFVQSRRLYEQDLTLLQERGEQRALLSALNGLGQLALREAKHEEALRIFNSAIDHAYSCGDNRFVIAIEVGLGSVYEDSARFAEAKVHYRRALEHSDEQNMPQQTASIHTGLAGLANMEGRYADCIQHCNDAIRLAQRCNDGFTETAALELASGALVTIGDDATALDYLHRLRNRAQEIGSLLRHAGAHNLIATVYAKRRDFSTALEHFREAQQLFDLLQDHRGCCYSRANVAQALLDLDRIADADVCVDEALQMSRLHSFHDLEIEILPIRCAIALRVRNPQAVVHELEHGLELCRRHRFERGFALITKCLADCYRELQSFDRVKDNYELAFNTAKKVHDADLEASIAESLSTYYADLQQFGEAYHWSTVSREAERRHINDTAERSARNMIVLLETERFQHERDQLRQQNELLLKENEFKQKELSALALHLVHKNELLERLRGRAQNSVQDYSREAKGLIDDMVQHIDSALRDDATWETFHQQFRRLHTGFVEQLSERYPALTPMERKVCALLKIQLSTKEIAAALVISTRTVEDHRNRLRKKFSLKPDQSLSAFLSAIS